MPLGDDVVTHPIVILRMVHASPLKGDSSTEKPIAADQPGYATDAGARRGFKRRGTVGLSW